MFRPDEDYSVRTPYLLDEIEHFQKAFRPDEDLPSGRPPTDLNAFPDVVRSSYASDASKANRSFYKACS